MPGPHDQQEPTYPNRLLHDHRPWLLSRVPEPQCRWYATVESTRRDHGGDPLVAQMTSLDPKMIQRGREEVAAGRALDGSGAGTWGGASTG